MTDGHPGEGAVLDLVLGEGDEREREEIWGHLALCEACARDRAELAEGARLVLAAAPAISPPLGFESRVLTALRSARVTSASDEQRRSTPVEELYRPRRGRRLRPGWGAAVAAAAGLVVGVAGTAAVLDRRGPGTGSVGAVDTDPSSVPAEVGAFGPALRTADGSRVGTVLESRLDGKGVLVVTITDGTAGMRYECALLLADGRREAAGSWVLPDAPGVTWVVRKPEGEDVVGVELVAASGRTWATASLARR